MSKPSRRKNRLNKKERRELKNRRRQNLAVIREIKNDMDAKIMPRTQAHNRKSQADTIEQQRLEHEAIFEAQMKVWGKMLPSLIRKFSEIKDPRQPGMIKHKITVVMFFGLLQFLFRVQSRRAFNEHLTAPSVMETLQRFFPEVDSIPHADTVARLLERITPDEIEAIHMSMLKKLINNRKFNTLLINQCLPISIDGTQKAVRNGQLQEGGWLLRTVTTKEGKEYQQYVCVIEANITFHNGLTIPLLTEYCYLDIDLLDDELAKQDSELPAFGRIAEKLKRYFPRRKMILLLDNLYACDGVFALLKDKKWEFMIKLPAKLKALYDPLKELRANSIPIPGQRYYRERAQSFHWINSITYNEHTLHAVACNEKWPTVSETTGKIVTKYSEHTWVSSQPLSMSNVHLLCNLAARKRAFIEDSFNTEKNRGYHYQHLFSYNWNAMRGFHLLMRLAHAINAISEFTKSLKKYIRELGVSNTLVKIFEAIKHLWLSEEWFEKQSKKTPQLRFQFE